MGEFKDYYQILGIKREDASPESVRKAYRAKIMGLNLDTCTDLETRTRFFDLQAARAILGDPLKRIQYDGERDSYLFSCSLEAIRTKADSLYKQAEKIVIEAARRDNEIIREYNEAMRRLRES